MYPFTVKALYCTFLISQQVNTTVQLFAKNIFKTQKSLTGPATYTGVKICLLVISLGLRLKALINGMSVRPYYRINFWHQVFFACRMVQKGC